MPPSLIEITKVPEKGQLLATLYGQDRVLEVGDRVPTNTIKYD
jgi:hypothetical protein